MKQFNDLTIDREVIYEIYPNGEIKERKVEDMILDRYSLKINIISEGKPLLNVRGDEYWIIKNNIIYTPNKKLVELISFIQKQCRL